MAAPPPDQQNWANDDLELQMAIALSLQEVQASSNQQPPDERAQQSSQSRAEMQTALAQALSSVLGTGAQGPTSPPEASNLNATAAEIARQMALFQQSQAGSTSSAGGPPATAAPPGAVAPAATTAPATSAGPRAPVPAPPSPDTPMGSSLPVWALELDSWWDPAPAQEVIVPRVASKSPALPDIQLKDAEELKQFQQLLGKALGVAVLSPADQGASGIILQSSSAPGGSVIIKAADLSSLLQLWLRRPSLIASGTSQFRALHNAFDALPDPASLTSSVASAFKRVASLLGHTTFQLLVNDEEDLYYDRGQHTTELLKALKTPRTAGAGISIAFLEHIAAAAHDVESATHLVTLLRAVIDDLKSIKYLGQSALEVEPMALSMDAATSPPIMQRCLAMQLLGDVLYVGSAATPTTTPAQYLEGMSILTPILHISSLVDPLSALSRRVAGRAVPTLQQLKGFPTHESEISTAVQVLGQLQARMQDVLHGMLKRIVVLKEGVSPGVGREIVVCWITAAARVNWERTLAGERGIAGQAAQEFTTGASDGWCVNMTALCLRFARPFVEGYWDTKSGKFADLFDKHLSPAYYATQPHRLPDLTKINSLAGDRGTSVWDAISQLPPTHYAPLPSGPTPWLVPYPPGLPGSPSFIADCFFAAQTWLHVGLLPALHRYHRMYEMLHSAAEQEGTTSDGRATGPMTVQLMLLYHSERAALLEPRFVEDTVQFCLLQICWLHHYLCQPGGVSLFSHIPDYVLSDSITWLHFVISNGLAVHVASKDIGALTAALAALLDAPQAVKSTVAADKMSRLLLAMLAPQLAVAKKAAAAGGRGALAPTSQRPGEAALVAAVLNSPAAQSGALAAALMRAYAAADHVVGLDVDRDSFDKFSMRSCIDSIMEELWRDPRGRSCLLSLAAATTTSTSSTAGSHSGSAFDEYVGCVFNSLIYLFKDSLDRLVDISKVEAAKRDEAGWQARSAEDRQLQEGFLRSQAHTCRGFMRISLQTLDWLNLLTEHPDTGAALCRPPLSARVAYAIIHFVELLTSSKAQQLQVDRPEQYRWDRLGLLARVLGLALRLSQCQAGPAFVAALAAEPDLDVDILTQAQAQLEAAHHVMQSSQLAVLITSLNQAQFSSQRSKHGLKTSDSQGDTGGELCAPAGLPPPTKRSRVEGAEDVVMTGAAGVPAGLPDLPGPRLPPADLAAQYSQQLRELQVGTFDADAARAYHSAFNAMAAESAAAASMAMMKRVSKEIRDLTTKAPLPCEPAAAIFVRYDQQAMSKMRALVTGPAGTPYAYGCFVFDLLFPPGYPNTPMLVNFETTGQGRARFNPNLYHDGKVCLSLINTWHASHESEKWNPEQTTTFQVLISIQSMILVEDPYYNEPAHEAARGTDVGQSSAATYNAQLTLNTLRWAIIDKLRSPPPGLEDVVRAHFKLLKHEVMDVAKQWAAAAQATGDEALAKRTLTEVATLHDLLAAL